MSTPEALYRNAIDLNRYSNSVARRVINAYNDIIIDAVNQLRTIDELVKRQPGNMGRRCNRADSIRAARHCRAAI